MSYAQSFLFSAAKVIHSQLRGAHKGLSSPPVNNFGRPIRVATWEPTRSVPVIICSNFPWETVGPIHNPNGVASRSYAWIPSPIDVVFGQKRQVATPLGLQGYSATLPRVVPALRDNPGLCCGIPSGYKAGYIVVQVSFLRHVRKMSNLQPPAEPGGYLAE